MNWMEKFMRDVSEKRCQILEDFCKAYLAETGLSPSEVALVQECRGGKVVWHFEPLKDKKFLEEKNGS